MGTLYTSWKDELGVSHIDEPVAVFENGKIYTATDGFLGTTAKGVLIGEYEDGAVYTVGTGAFNPGKRLNAVAIIENGNIYSISKSMLGGISKSLSVGECSNGNVCSHSHKFMEGNKFTGLYNGDEEGAAAAAAIALFKLNSNVSAYDSSLRGDSSYKNSSYNDGEDLWEKYGLLMPIVVTYRFFKYSFIVGKWIVAIIAWLTRAITRLVQNYKEKKALEEKTIETQESETEIDENKHIVSFVDNKVVQNTDFDDSKTVYTQKHADTLNTPVLKNEGAGDVTYIEKNKVVNEPFELVEEKETSSKTTTTGRVQSTMKKNAEIEHVKGTNRFKPAGDL